MYLDLECSLMRMIYHVFVIVFCRSCRVSGGANDATLWNTTKSNSKNNTRKNAKVYRQKSQMELGISLNYL